MRHRIAIQKQKVTRGTGGQENVIWTEVSTALPARIEPLSMNEQFRAQQVQSEISMRMTIRYQSDITPKMRVLYNDESYDIESVINRGQRDKELILLCSRVST